MTIEILSPYKGPPRKSGRGVPLLASRWGRVLLTGLSTVAARSTAILTLLFLIPLAAAHLGPARFALWMIVSGFAMVFSFADFGVGGSVVNEVAAAEAHDEHHRAVRAISNGLGATCLLSFAFAGAGIAAAVMFRWELLLNISDPVAASEASRAVFTFVCAFSLQLPLAIATRVQNALQRGFIGNVSTLVGNIGAFCVTLLGLHLGWSVPALLGAFFGVPIISFAANHLIFFRWIRPDLAPRIKEVTRAGMLRHVRTGSAFLVLQFAAIGLIRFDPMIVANRAGLLEGGLYSALDRLFAMAGLASGAFLGPLWPAYREAILKGDDAWWRPALLRSTLGAMGIAAIIGLVLTLSAPWLGPRWLRLPLTVPPALFISMAFLRVGEAGFTSLAVFLNGAGALRPAAALMTSMLVVSLVLKIYGPWTGAVTVSSIGGGVYLAGLLAGALGLYFGKWHHVRG